MGFFDGVEPIVQSVSNFLGIFIIEASDNTQDSVDYINEFFIREFSKKDSLYGNALILAFSNGAEWMYDEPWPKNGLNFRNMHSGGGNCDLGAACNELNKKLLKLSKKSLDNRPFSLSITLISSGKVTDDFSTEIQKLNENPLFSESLKIAVAVGDNADKTTLTMFTGCSDTVIQFSNTINFFNWYTRWKSEIPSIFIGEKYSDYINFWYNADEVWTKELVLFFLIGTSDSMRGTKIGAVNTAIREILPELQDAGGSDVDLKVACLKFSTDCEWMYPMPIKANCFQWQNISASGRRNLGFACRELDKKLSTKYLRYPTYSYAPVIILMLDGEPTDDFEAGLAVLKQNYWFRYAIKLAVAIGDDANKNVLAKFTGNIEAVITVHSPEALKKWIRKVEMPDFDGKDVMIDEIKEIQQSVANLESAPTSDDDW